MPQLRSYFHKAASNLTHSWVSAVPTIVVMSLVLTMFHGLLAVHEKAVETLGSISEKFTVTVYLKESADLFEVSRLVGALDERSDVTPPVVYTSKEEAWNLLSKTFPLDSSLQKKYAFSLPASLTIRPKTPADGPHIEKFLKTNFAHMLQDPAATGDKQKSLNRQVLEFIRNVEKTTQKTLLFFIVLFIAGGALLMSSTIHLAISHRHLEMDIMKLVGASQAKITAPFVVEGILMAVASFGLHLVLILLLPLEIGSSTMRWNALLGEFAVTVTLGGAVSWMTTIFYLRKKNL